MNPNTAEAVEQFSIGTAARLAGVSPHRLRKWEQRYEAVSPARSKSNRRRYSRSDVARLGLLRELTEQGHRIGDVAGLDEVQLQALLDENLTLPQAGAGAVDRAPGYECFCQRYLEAVTRFDLRRSADVLARAAALVSFEDFVYRVVLPVLREVGARWERGEMSVAHEHLVSNQVRSLLASRLHWAPARPGATRVVVATPEGHLHEFGVLVGALLAARHGLEPLYLGPSLPEADLLGAVEDSHAGLVLLSVERDCDDEELDALAATLERLAVRQPVWVGLPAEHALRERATGARYLDSLEELDQRFGEAVAEGRL